MSSNIWCAECTIPTDDERLTHVPDYGWLCYTCKDMLDVIRFSNYWINVQARFERDKKNINKLKSGGDYFSGE